MICLRFTPSEKARIEELAGLVPVATFLKDKLMTQTDLAERHLGGTNR